MATLTLIMFYSKNTVKFIISQCQAHVKISFSISY